MNELLKRHSGEIIRSFYRKYPGHRPSWDYSEAERRLIIETANQRGFFICVKNHIHPSFMGGIRLDFPNVGTNQGHQAEITWRQAEMIAKGFLKIIKI
jgi:hypothetical protein